MEEHDMSEWRSTQYSQDDRRSGLTLTCPDEREDCNIPNYQQFCTDKAPQKANALVGVLDEDKREKEVFARALLPLLQIIDGAIVSAEYQASDVREYECVTIEYRNGYQARANVTGDSLKALAIDVLEAL